MTPSHLRALHILASHRAMTAGDLGWALWGPPSPPPIRGAGRPTRNKYCLPAAALLNQLLAAGLAHAKYYDTHTLWHISQAGRDRLPADLLTPATQEPT